MYKSLTKTELEALTSTAYCDSPLMGLLVQTIFNHGLRIGEALSITRDNIQDGYLILNREKKSNKVEQSLCDNEREALENLAKTVTGRFFPMCRKTVWSRIQRYAKVAGIPQFKAHPHALRHTTGRLAYEAGLGLPDIQQVLGHVSGANTMIYMQSDSETAYKAFQRAVGL
jgi:integrase